ncbi:MAG: serine/threonine-protein kinase [Pirellulaceae bacterium]
MASKFLGPYEIIGVLGRGGMGTVFKGKHETTGELVAIKALSHSTADETHFRNRFESEIQALLKLNHPNIVRILSFGQEKGTLFFAMELIEGKSLFHLQREVKKFDWRDVLRIARDVAQALRHAHDRGIIHRDLKPGNLMKCDKDGVIKVADFGIAKSFGTSHDTRDNVIGTLDFMSPEQATGKPVTVRSDLYSLGAVLYTLLSGHPPFTANSIEESLRNLTRVPATPIRERVANVPEELDMLISELLEKQPEKRTPTAFALLRKLDYVEQVLKNSSEARTAQSDRSSESKAPKSGRTPPPPEPPDANVENFELDAPGNRLDKTSHGTQANTGRPQKSARPKAARSAQMQTRLSNETVADPLSKPQTDDEPLKLKEPEARHDYFSTVTDKHRGFNVDEPQQTAEKSGLGVFSILLLLVTIVALAAAGTYVAFKPPTAQRLYETIEAGAANPTTIRDEMNAFLTHYPEDERAGKVKELLALADAHARYKLMALRQNVPGESKLSPVEQAFVAAVSEVNSDAAAGIEKLRAFVNLNEGNLELNEEERITVQAAIAILKSVEPKVEDAAYESRQQIIQNLDRARNAEPEAARELYESIIKMYGDLPYAQDLIEQARNELDSLTEGDG